MHLDVGRHPQGCRFDAVRSRGRGREHEQRQQRNGEERRCRSEHAGTVTGPAECPDKPMSRILSNCAISPPAVPEPSTATFVFLQFPVIILRKAPGLIAPDPGRGGEACFRRCSLPMREPYAGRAWAEKRACR
jgi:hypothetical protein